MTLAEFWPFYCLCCLHGNVALPGRLRKWIAPIRQWYRAAYGWCMVEPICLQYAQKPVTTRLALMRQIEVTSAGVSRLLAWCRHYEMAARAVPRRCKMQKGLI